MPTAGDIAVLLWSISQQQSFAVTNLQAVFSFVSGKFSILLLVCFRFLESRAALHGFLRLISGLREWGVEVSFLAGL